MIGRISKYKVLAAGILSPPAAAFLGLYVYSTLTGTSADLNQDFVTRLALVILAMITPFVVTLLLAFRDSRHGMLTRSSKVGLSIAVLSLGLTWMPLRGLIGRVQQAQNVAIRDVAAPPFDTLDILGKPHRFQDHLGKVVLINAWATWCAPCKKEMPELDRLYQKRKDEGFIVFGLSTEEVDLQMKFVSEELSVSYPLLTADGDVPSLYRDIQRWPALFLIDRKGQLQPVAQAGEPFEKVEAAVDALLKDE